MYDFLGRPISGVASSVVHMFDPVAIDSGKIVNLLNPSSVSVGRFDGFVLNQDQTAYRASDYIEIKANQPYVAQFDCTSGNTGYDKVLLFNTDKVGLLTVSTKLSDGKRYATFIPSYDGYMRFCWEYKDGNENAMVFKGTSVSDKFVPYGSTSEDNVEYEYHIATDFKNMIRRDVEPSNIYGKKICMIGDSNSDNWANGVASQLVDRYGCTIKGYGKYGATWGDSTGTGSTADSTAIGQYNKMVSENPIDASTKLLPSDCVFLFMMGTNTASGGIGTINDTGVDTDLGACNWILKRIRYYGRANAIGVFLPWACSEAKRNGIIQLCEKYKIPYFDIPSIICEDSPTSELASQNYITDGGNHLAEHGWKAFVRMAHPWIAHNI